MENIQLTLYVKLDWGVGHSHHILCDAGQLEVVVVSADVEKSQVDGVDVRPVNVRLWAETRRYRWRGEKHCEVRERYTAKPIVLHCWGLKF